MPKNIEPVVFASDLAQQAGAILMKYFGTKLTHNIKTGPDDYATEADLASEKMIIEALEKEFPADSIIAEESGVHAKTGAVHTWIIDPLDGTLHFANRRDNFAVLIARATAGGVTLAVMYNPARELLAIAQPQQGTVINDKAVLISNMETLANKPLGVGRQFHAAFRRQGFSVEPPDIFAALTGQQRTHISGGTKVWDYAPRSLAFAEAGFTVSDFTGDAYTWQSARQGIIATHPGEHEALVRLTQSAESHQRES